MQGYLLLLLLVLAVLFIVLSTARWSWFIQWDIR
jgi:hypothetical protein